MSSHRATGSWIGFVGFWTVTIILTAAAGCDDVSQEPSEPACAAKSDGDKSAEKENEGEQGVGADVPAPQPDPTINELNDGGFSKLHGAAKGGDVKEAEALLRAGADPNVRQATFHGTPLQYAAANGHLDVVRLLLKHHASVDAADNIGRTPLIWAATEGRLDVVKTLLDADANPNAATNNGWTALHYAVMREHRDTAQWLLDHGASADSRNTSGKTPIELNPGLELRVPETKP